MRVSSNLVVGNICLKCIERREGRNESLSIKLSELEDMIGMLKAEMDRDESQKRFRRYVDVSVKDILDTLACYPDYVVVERGAHREHIIFRIKKHNVVHLKNNLNAFTREVAPKWLNAKIDSVLATM